MSLKISFKFVRSGYRGNNEEVNNQVKQDLTNAQWAAGGFEEFLNIMNFYVFLIVWDNRVNKL